MNTEEKIDIILRQTDYDRTQVEQKLAQHNNDVTAVIRDYLNAGKVIAPYTKPRLSTNQQVYKEIRGMMDDAAKTYLEKKKKGEQ